MTYGEFKRLALGLAFTESISGEAIPGSYNCQSDYLRMLPGLLDSALFQIASSAERIPALASFSALPQSGELYRLPKDCLKPLRIIDLSAPFGRVWSAELSGGFIKAPEGCETPALEYWRRPASVGETPADTAELDCSPEAGHAAALYSAAHLCLYDDPFRYTALSEEYDTALSRLTGRGIMTWEALPNSYEGLLNE